jgi:hypothetical protein
VRRSLRVRSTSAAARSHHRIASLIDAALGLIASSDFIVERMVNRLQLIYESHDQRAFTRVYVNARRELRAGLRTANGRCSFVMSFSNRVAALDQTLRGAAVETVADGRAIVRASASHLAPLLLALAMFYGGCMGSFAVVSGRAGAWRQMISSAIKVPALFSLTLLVTFPSLYVFNALVGSRLNARALLNLLVSAMGVTIALLASFGTIVAFFSFTTDSHPFMVVLNVVAFAVAGIVGLSFLLRTLKRVSLPQDLSEGSIRIVFRLWLIVFALVGTQMSWVLRPFVGGEAEFALFRARGSNFFQAVYYLALKLVGG